jgi:hypothetical protein
LPKRRSSSSSSLQADVVREGALAASHENRREEQVAFIDQPGPERMRGKLGTAHGEVTSRRRLEVADRVRVEVALDPRPRRR